MSLIRIRTEKQNGVVTKKSVTERQVEQAHPLAPVNVDVVANALNLVEVARELGSKELPPSDQKGRVSEEVKIDNEIQKKVTEYASWTEKDLQNHQNRLHSDESDIRSSKLAIPLMPAQFEQESEMFLREQESDRLELLKEYRDHTKIYEDFRKANNLQRQAVIQSKPAFWTKIIVLVGLIVAEGALNAHFFGMNMEGGLVQGFIYAAGFAAMNSLVMFFIGRYALCYWSHVSKTKRRIAVGGLVFALFYVVFLAFFIAHFRQALQESLDGAVIRAWLQMIDNPFYLTELASWLLLGLTILCGLMALVDGKSAAGDYPGYEAVQLAYDKAREEWDHHQTELREKLDDLKKRYIRQMEDGIAASRNALQSFRQTINEKVNTRYAYEAARKNARVSWQALVGKFRDENRKVRTTPAPAYFDEWDKDVLEDIKLTELNFSTKEQDDEMLVELEQIVTELAEGADAHQRRILTSFNKYCSAIQADEGGRSE